MTCRLAANSRAFDQVVSHWRGADMGCTFVPHDEEASSLLRPGFTYIVGEFTFAQGRRIIGALL